MLVRDRVITDTCLLVFVLWHDNPRVFIRMRILLFLYGGPKGHAMRRCSRSNTHVTVDDFDATIDDIYVTIDNNDATITKRR